MTDGSRLHAELVMRRADGRSILDIEGPVTSGSTARFAGDLPEDRVAEIRARLEKAGFSVDGGNANTLSISGPPRLFAEAFGLDPDRGGGARHIRADLAPYVADVFIPAPPEFFP